MHKIMQGKVLLEIVKDVTKEILRSSVIQTR